jgi:phosphomevalonate kinase
MDETGKQGKFCRESRIIAISGKQYSGKDMLADLILVRLPEFQKIPLALAIKVAYAKQHQLTLEELEANKAQHRPGLIALGNWGRTQDPDYWLKQVLTRPGKILISDMRLKREYDLLKQQGAFLIRLEADRGIRATRGQIVSEDDATENELDSVTDWDLMLNNNQSVADLKARIDTLF